jgi:secondary thiamine-phosphate synthase enzyme
MKILTRKFDLKTLKRNDLIDITDPVRTFAEAAEVKNGEVTVFCPHTTAAITINENADPDVISDILLTLSQLIPQHRAAYRHSEGNSDAHAKSSIVGASEHVLIQDERLLLGTWQGIYFCEFDGPRPRTYIVQVRGE